MNFLKLTNMSDKVIYVNMDIITTVFRESDTITTMHTQSGTKVSVKETPEQINAIYLKQNKGMLFN